MPNRAPADFRSILITGASSGLGRALACCYASPGTRLELAGRNKEELGQTASHCAAAGAEVSTALVDVTDREAMARWTRGANEHAPIDLVIACAGVSGETGAPGDGPSQAEWIYRVNVLGALNTVEPLLPAMRARRRGQIGLVASMAGFRGFPRGPAYSGSKAAMIVHGQAWREALSDYGIGVSVICPGYLRTPMTARHGFRLPFVLDASTAAARIAAGLAHNQGRIIFPWPMPIVGWLFRALPASATRLLIPRLRRP